MNNVAKKREATCEGTRLLSTVSMGILIRRGANRVRLGLTHLDTGNNGILTAPTPIYR